VTGAHSDRRELLKLLKSLAAGDTATVMRIDRLTRSTFDLFGIARRIVDAKAQFRSLVEPWADTGTSTGRLMLARTRRLGRREARPDPHAHGGGPQPRQGSRTAHRQSPKLTEAQKVEARRRGVEGATLKELAESYDVGLATISRLAS
jgi:DNA invertase Pin-like site-specific DNA recombinase